MNDDFRKLSASESIHERLNNFDEIPDFAPFKWINQYFNHRGFSRSDRTYTRWRNELLFCCTEYQRLAIANGIDNYFLSRRQIQLLEEFGCLVVELGSIKLAIAQYMLKHSQANE